MIKRRGGRWFAPIWRPAGALRLRGVLRALLILTAVLTGSLLSTQLARALMGGEGLMWLVSPDVPIVLDVCWENPHSRAGVLAFRQGLSVTIHGSVPGSGSST
jgi:hypothetical protein